ncbi:MAG: hypothetical protein JXQ97_12120 [Natronospirillum sp.]
MSVTTETNVAGDASPTELMLIPAEDSAALPASDPMNQLPDYPNPNGILLAEGYTATLDFAGIYSLGMPINSEIFITTIKDSANQWQVQFYAKGDPDDAAGIGADCYFVAHGSRVGATLAVAPVPFEQRIS